MQTPTSKFWARGPQRAQGKALTGQKPWLPGEVAQVRHPDGADGQDSPGDRDMLAATQRAGHRTPARGLLAGRGGHLRTLS